jgi:hypothetical protein
MMTKMGAKLAEQSDQIAELTAQVAALSIKLEKQEKPENPVTTFAGLYGALMLNEDGSGKRFRHIAELKNGEDDERPSLAWNFNELRDWNRPPLLPHEVVRLPAGANHSSWNFC